MIQLKIHDLHQPMSVLTSLAQYADSGTVSLFYMVIGNLELHMKGNYKSYKIPTPVAMKVTEHLLKHIADREKVFHVVKAWSALAFLCERMYNSNAFDVLGELQSTTVLTHAARSIAADGEEAEQCYKFLQLYSRADGDRQILIGELDGLFEAHMSFFDKHFQIGAFNLTTNLLGRNIQSSSVNTNKFAVCGGFGIVLRAVQSTKQNIQAVKLSRNLTEGEESLVHSCIACLTSVFAAMSHVWANETYDLSIPRELYEYDKAQLITLRDAVYFFTTLSDGIRIKDASIVLFIRLWELLRLLEPDQLEATLLYTGEAASRNSANAQPGVSLFVHFLRVIRDPQLAHWKEHTLECINTYTGKFPSVKAVWQQELLRNGDLPYTLEKQPSIPTCGLNNFNCGGGLKRCLKCKTVG